MKSSLILVLVFALLLGVISTTTVSAQQILSPAFAENKGLYTGNTTFVTSAPAVRGDFIFLYSGADCSTAPAYSPATESQRTAENVTIDADGTVSLNLTLLASPADYRICHSNASDGVNFTQQGWVTVTVGCTDPLSKAIITPRLITTDAGNATFSLNCNNATAGDYVFLYSGASCDTAPYLTSATASQRTSMVRVRTNGTVRLDVSRLAAGTYQVCAPVFVGNDSNVFPTDYVSITTITVLHTVYMDPSTLNIDQKNVTVQMYHVTAGNSIFLIRYATDGVKTGLTCSNLATTSTANRTAVSLIGGDLKVYLDLSNLTVGEYLICASTAPYVDPISTTFVTLGDTVDVVQTRICHGGGATGICSVTPTYTDKRVGTQRFTLYPARPRTYAFMLRKEYCGVPTGVTCATASATDVTNGMASPTARLNYDRTVDIDVSKLQPGNYVFCHLNVSSSTIPSFATFKQITAVSNFSVSGGIEASKTVVSCCSSGNTYVAGDIQWCTVNTYDLFGSPSGIADDVCTMVANVIDNTGAQICNVSQLYFRQIGKFEFSFVPTKSGITTAGMTHFNVTWNNATRTAGGSVASSLRGATMTISPAVFDEMNSIASCAKSGADDVCSITNRDKYNNVIGTCTHSSTDGLMCNGVGF